jgi:hypothetical protein
MMEIDNANQKLASQKETALFKPIPDQPYMWSFSCNNINKQTKSGYSNLVNDIKHEHPKFLEEMREKSTFPTKQVDCMDALSGL